MKRILVLLLLFLLIFMTSALAFDGKRKGFVLGGRFGVAPMARWSAEYQGLEFDENRTGFGLNWVIGYGWDEYNIAILETNDIFYQSDILHLSSIRQGFLGPAWYHYFGPPGRSFFSVIGIGVCTFHSSGSYFRICWGCEPEPPTPPSPSAARGVGYLIGSGYEFARHFQIAGYLSGGHTSEHETSYVNTHITILLSDISF